MGLIPFGASAPLFLRNGELLGHSPYLLWQIISEFGHYFQKSCPLGLYVKYLYQMWICAEGVSMLVVFQSLVTETLGSSRQTLRLLPSQNLERLLELNLYHQI
jgi:hypothetical protein